MKAADVPLRHRAILATTATLLSGAIGYGISRHSSAGSALRPANTGSPAAEDAMSDKAIPSPAGDKNPTERRAHLSRLRSKLLLEIRSSPNIYVDYELKRELHRQLAVLSAEELEELFNTPMEGRSQEVRELQNWILNAWVLKDPAAALQASGEGCVHVFNHWGFADHEAALTWLRDAKLTGPLEGKRLNMRLNFLVWLARIDFERAKQEWPYMDEAERKFTLGAWTDSSEDFLGHREALLDFIGEQMNVSDGKSIDREVLARLAAVDVEAARRKVEGIETSPAERAELEVAILKGVVRRDTKTALANWLEHHPKDQAVPESFTEVLGHGFLYKEEETTQWLDSLPPGSMRDLMHEKGSWLIASRGKFDKAAAYIDDIADPRRKENATAVLKTLWMEADPAKATEWLNKSGAAEGK